MVASPPVPALEIHVLGPLEVLLDGRPLVVDTRKALAILALLAVEDRPFARDELAAMLWPESDDESARGALRRTLSVLRTALGGRWLGVDRSVVALEPGVDVDVRALEAAVGHRDPALLSAAAALARGPFLAGFSLRDSPQFDDWRATRSVAIERSVAAVLGALASAAEANGDLPAAVVAASRQVELDPIEEPAQRRLIGLLARSGDRSGAVRQYRVLVALLERELGVAPLAETTALYEAIRDGRLGPTRHAEPAMAGGDRSAPDDRSAAIPGPGRTTPASSRLPMVGRDQPLAAVRSAHRGAAPDGRIVLISGEAGIGKTRLAEELLAAASMDGARSLLARAFPGEDGIPYGTVVELLRAGLQDPEAPVRLGLLDRGTLSELARLVSLPPAMGSATAPAPVGDLPTARARLLGAVAGALTALVAGDVPGLIVVEDVQWLDDASRDALGYLARRLQHRPLAMIVAYRPEDLDERGGRFVGGLADLPEATSVTLSRLDRADISRLIDAAVAAGLERLDLDRLIGESEGLPLFVVEAMAAGPDALGGPSRGVRGLLRERLAGVGETAGQVLSAAAVIGRSFDLATARVASGRSEDETVAAIEELVQRGIVRELHAGRGAAFDFAHARLREAAYERTSLARRRLLHRRVAEALRAEPSGRDDPGRLALIAGHLRAAGQDAEAADAYRLAGSRARALYANEEALAHLETAIALGHPDAASLQIQIGELLMTRGDYAGAIRSLEAAASVVPDEELPGVELRLGRVHARRGDLPTAAGHLEAAIAGMANPQDPSTWGLLSRTLVERAAVAARAGDLDQAADAAGRALDLAAEADDDPARGAAQRILGLVAQGRGDLAGARTALERSLALAEDGSPGPDDAAAIGTRNALALVEAATGNRAGAIELLEQALIACRRIGDRHLEAAVENNLADQLHGDGRPEEAMAHLKRAVAIFADIGGTPGELEPEIWKLVTW